MVCILKFKKQVSVIVLLFMVFNQLAFASPSDWAKSAYYALKYEEVIDEGLSVQGLFQKDVTREEFIEILMKLYLDEKNLKVEGLNTKDYFVDTNNPFIEYAYALGVVNGIGSKRFAPYRQVTRQEMAVMMKNVLVQLDLFKSSSKQANFKDRDAMASWSVKAIDGCFNLGIINGMPDGNFRPTWSATREESFKLVSNIYERFNLKESFNTDAPSINQGSYKTYNSDESNLEVYESNGQLVILSKGIADFGETLNIKEDHYQVYRILDSHEKVSFKAVNQCLTQLNTLYDSASKKYIKKTVYIDLETGALLEDNKRAHLRIDSDEQLKITVK